MDRFSKFVDEYLTVGMLIKVTAVILVLWSFCTKGVLKDKEPAPLSTWGIQKDVKEKIEAWLTSAAGENAAKNDTNVAAPTPPVPPVPEPIIAPLPNEMTASQMCTLFGEIEPDEVLDLLNEASRRTGTPVPVLVAIWLNESGGQKTGEIPYRMCPVMDELARRDAAAGRSHVAALREMAGTFGWNLDTMRCSCPSTSSSYGGSCGPFMFSPGEVAKLAIPMRIDPMLLCGGALIAGIQLKQHRDTAVQRYRLNEMGAWAWAIRRYRGGPNAPCKYGVNGKYIGGCGYLDKTITSWEMVYAWYEQDPVGQTVLRVKLAELLKRGEIALERWQARHATP